MVATRQVTVQEFAALPLDGVWELIEGEPVELMASGGRSGWIALRIGSRLEQFVSARDLGWVFSAETGFILFPDRETVRSPDAAVVMRGRLEVPPETFVPMAPDLAVEVLSPSDRMSEALAKVAMYLEAGVRLVWLVDPGSHSVAVFRPDAAPATLDADGILDGGDVLPGFALPLSEVFS